MSFVSFEFVIFLAAVILFYYLLPVRMRWMVLLTASMGFYVLSAGKAVLILAVMIIVSFLFSLVISRNRKKIWLAAAITATVLPVLITKNLEHIWVSNLHRESHNFIAVLGISFFVMQMIAYYVDIYRGKTEPEKNPFRYALFISFFPQILQGPIPRFSQLHEQLNEGHKFDPDKFTKGLQLIIWGFFLKLMIADKAGIFVDEVFSNTDTYKGAYIWIAAILYSVQLYADFSSCVSIAQGVSELMGIRLSDNFDHPYFSLSIKEFWGRWHMSLSSWLKDYIYIPLGGNRKGAARKYLNVMITFIVSGIWHGSGLNYLAWGVMHGMYQITGALTEKPRDAVYRVFGVEKNTRGYEWLKRAGTFFWVMLAWVMFRAESLTLGIEMICSMFSCFNPWVLFSDSILELGLSWREWCMLILSVYTLVRVSELQKKCSIRDRIMAQPLIFRWALYILAIVVIFVFGTYGHGFSAKDFIYAGF
ncbi:MAG: hypothetical protein K6F39_03185 [Lachnospiraceae bacterium]|nr:hypothetical protein [Lachnospiraceae bacterium]